jgi:hypothetical protein
MPPFVRTIFPCEGVNIAGIAKPDRTGGPAGLDLKAAIRIARKTAGGVPGIIRANAHFPARPAILDAPDGQEQLQSAGAQAVFFRNPVENSNLPVGHGVRHGP